MEGVTPGPTRRLTPSRAKVLREAGSPLWPTQLLTRSRLHRGCRTLAAHRTTSPSSRFTTSRSSSPVAQTIDNLAEPFGRRGSFRRCPRPPFGAATGDEETNGEDRRGQSVRRSQASRVTVKASP